MNKFSTFVYTFFLTFVQTANACPVCFDANEKSRLAYYLTTAFLSLFPLAMIGCLVWWLKKYSEVSETYPVKQDHSMYETK
ncbi:MAG: hypothetical protein HN548_03580 [Opitutae bacterium]|jgi:hypothetical protein|nr:hypothetical protein [Opitutae bacterium]